LPISMPPTSVAEVEVEDAPAEVTLIAGTLLLLLPLLMLEMSLLLLLSRRRRAPDRRQSQKIGMSRVLTVDELRPRR